MPNDLSLSRTVPHAVTADEARSALLKAAKRVGKASVNMNGDVVVRPRTAIHRLTMRPETDHNRSGSQVVTFSGTIGFSAFMGTASIIFMLVMMLTIVGLIISFIVANISRKIAAEAFKDISRNAIETLM